MGILTMLMPVTQATVLVTIMSLFSMSLNVWSVRRSVPWSETWPILASALPATLLGVYLLRNLDVQVLRTGVAVMILMGSVVALLSSKRARIHRPTPWAYIVGFVGGVFGGALSMGGPPVVLYTLLRGWQKSEAKAVICSYLFAANVLRLVLFFTSDIVTAAWLRQGLLLSVPGLVASFVGTRLFRRLSTPTFRYAATAVLVGLAARIILA